MKSKIFFKLIFSTLHSISRFTYTLYLSLTFCLVIGPESPSYVPIYDLDRPAAYFFVFVFFNHDINMKYLPSLIVTNLYWKVCWVHKMDSLILTRFFLYTRESKFEPMITYLKCSNPLSI